MLDRPAAFIIDSISGRVNRFSSFVPKRSRAIIAEDVERLIAVIAERHGGNVEAKLFQ